MHKMKSISAKLKSLSLLNNALLKLTKAHVAAKPQNLMHSVGSVSSSFGKLPPTVWRWPHNSQNKIKQTVFILLNTGTLFPPVIFILGARRA